MNKLEVGMYIRTKQLMFQSPQIAKIKNMTKDSGYKNQYYIELDHNLIPDYKFHIYQEDILKSSYNIIDLIEVGDIVITPLGEIIQPHGGNIDELKDYWKITNNPIKSIVTKEMFEQMKYDVGDSNE